MAKPGGGMPVAPQQQVAVNEASLDFDEVAKLFTMPVSEAANMLGVCQTTLNRICRQNGLNRWPHRKVLQGRSVEEIKQEAAKAKYYAMQQQQAYHSHQPSVVAHASTPHHHQSLMMQHHHQQALPRQVKMPANARYSTMAPSWKTKMPMPSFVDDFRLGFPKELAALSTRWWGNEEEEDEDEQRQQESGRAVGAQKLVAVRRNKVESLRRVLNAPIAKGYGAAKLQAKEVAVLKFVFGEGMPKQWTYAV